MRTPLAAALCAAMIASSPLAAADSMVVKYNDLNLSTPAGQETLDRRIATAARKFCGLDVQTTGSRMKSREGQSCFASATKSAREQVAKVTGTAPTGA